MHYKNGREAKNGDKVALITGSKWEDDGRGGLKVVEKVVTVGILYDATVGNDHCNGRIAPISAGDPCPDLKECLRLDDLLTKGDDGSTFNDTAPQGEK